ncbi:MAG: hypothetical protein FJY42_05935 [Betaproteobacteria bacterium]|nr:hypothetical protein [Betaproteobacteria bacterium]
MAQRMAEFMAQFKAQLAAQWSALWPPGPLVLGGAGALATLALQGNSSGSAPSPAPAPDPPPPSAATVQGAITLGPAVSGHGLTISAYDASGRLLAQAALDAEGRYTLNLPAGYAGPVLLRVSDAGDGPEGRVCAALQPGRQHQPGCGG